MYARRTANGRCCSFYGRNGVRSLKRNDSQTTTGNGADMSKENAPMPATPSTKTMTSGNIKTNKQIEAQKKQMNQVIRKLESVNVKRKNITFDI